METKSFPTDSRLDDFKPISSVVRSMIRTPILRSVLQHWNHWTGSHLTQTDFQNIFNVKHGLTPQYISGFNSFRPPVIRRCVHCTSEKVTEFTSRFFLWSVNAAIMMISLQKPLIWEHTVTSLHILQHIHCYTNTAPSKANKLIRWQMTQTKNATTTQQTTVSNYNPAPTEAQTYNLTAESLPFSLRRLAILMLNSVWWVNTVHIAQVRMWGGCHS